MRPLRATASELEVDPELWFLEDEGYDLAVVHSHPEEAPTGARPSRTDVENVGLWEGRPYLIYSLGDGELLGGDRRRRDRVALGYMRVVEGGVPGQRRRRTRGRGPHVLKRRRQASPYLTVNSPNIDDYLWGRQ